MVEVVAERLKSQKIRTWTSVPFLSRCIDLIYRDVDNEIVAVEFKKHDWRRAIRQAKDHLLGVDFSYICLPLRNITQRLKEDLEENGIGLFFFNPDGEDLLKETILAKRSTFIWSVSRSWLEKTLQPHAVNLQKEEANDS